MNKDWKCKFKFIGLDNKEYTFISETNILNNNQMWTINDWQDCYYGNRADVKKVIKAIMKLK